MPGVPFATWLVFLIPMLLGLLVQTGAEEIVFRGYLQQQLAARFVARWVSFVFPSAPVRPVALRPRTDGAGTWLLVGLTGFFGLLMGRSDGAQRIAGAGMGYAFRQLICWPF